MIEFLSLLVHPDLLGLNALGALGMLVVWHYWTHLESSRIKLIRALTFIGFFLACAWAMQQQHHVLNGALLPSSDSPVKVSLRGVTHYVSVRQSWLYELSMLPMLIIGLLFVLIERAFFGQERKA